MELLAFLKTHPQYVDATNPTDTVLDAWTKEPVTVQRDATNGDVLAWAAGTDAISRLEGYSTGLDRGGNVVVTNAAKRGLADAALARVRAGLGLTLTDAKVQGLLAALVSNGMFIQAEIDALNAGAQTTVERWQHPDNQPLTLGGKPCRAMTLGMVTIARAV